MYSATITLTQTDPTDVTPMLALSAYVISAAAIPASGGTKGAKKLANILWFRIYAESGNNEDAANSFARIGFDTKTSRIAATAHGHKLFAGLEPKLYPPTGDSGTYDFNHTYIVGQTGDVFQIEWDVL
jgi:hypothetical protein